MEKVRFGIVGCGNIGARHANNLFDGKIKNGVLTAVCDINPIKLRTFCEIYGDKIKCFSTAEEMFKSGVCDCVVIAVPHFEHPALAILALDCDLHCVVEKPAGVYTLQVNEMLNRAKESDKILSIMFNQRTNPAFKMMRKMIQDGKIGQIKRTNWIITNWYRTQYYYDTGEWRATWSGEGGGVLYNQAAHQLDLFQWIVGMMPCKVRAFCHFGKWHDIEVEDDVTCYCEYPNGATGVFVTTTADAPGTNRFEITGTKGTILFENDKLKYTELKEDERIHCYDAKYIHQAPETYDTIEVEITGENSQHAGILSNVANAILGIEELYVPASDGIFGVELANAMLLSSWLDKTIELPIDGQKFYEELKDRIETSKQKEKFDNDIIICWH